jgi:ribosomal protein S18 acetylase RimI-like enzyme
MVVIRTGTLADLPQLSHLFNLYRIFYRKPPDMEGGRRFLQERIERRESVIYIAENEGQMVGFAQCYPLFSSTRMKRILLLNDLFVMEEYRGRGISRLLIGAAKELTKNTQSSCLLLETEKSNRIGNSLYPAEGFVLNEGSNFYQWENDDDH